MNHSSCFIARRDSSCDGSPNTQSKRPARKQTRNASGKKLGNCEISGQLRAIHIRGNVQVNRGFPDKLPSDSRRWAFSLFAPRHRNRCGSPSSPAWARVTSGKKERDREKKWEDREGKLSVIPAWRVDVSTRRQERKVCQRLLWDTIRNRKSPCHRNNTIRAANWR